MKKIYFKHETIEKVSDELLGEVRSSSHKPKTEFKPKESALLVLDMQRYFLDENSHAFVPSATAIVPGLKKLISEYKKLGFPIIFTKHINTAENAGRMSDWWSEIITEENKFSEIIPELIDDKDEMITKHQYDAFYKTNLKDYLKKKKVKQLVITGVITHLCCETTARSAFVNGFEVLFPIDGTATYNLDFHKGSLRNLAHGFSEIVTINELLEKLED